MVHVYKAHAERLLEHTTRIFECVLCTCPMSNVPQTLETLLKTLLANLTCPELEPQVHVEHRHPRDCSRSHFDLQNVAVARVWGTSKMVHVYKTHAKRLLEHTTHIFACVL